MTWCNANTNRLISFSSIGLVKIMCRYRSCRSRQCSCGWLSHCETEGGNQKCGATSRWLWDPPSRTMICRLQIVRPLKQKNETMSALCCIQFHPRKHGLPTDWSILYPCPFDFVRSHCEANTIGRLHDLTIGSLLLDGYKVDEYGVRIKHRRRL